MVSLRRKKNTVTVEGGQRRSARLLALEEQKNEHAAHTMLPMDAWQSSNDGHKSMPKQGRRKVRKVYEETQHPEEVSPMNNGNTSSSSALQKHTDQIIEYILDVLELKDTNELFTMPDDVQINDDYSERVKKPGDFATLRQKHKDGMYQTLEQFESDVYMVFRKAITSNATDSIPHREALCLQDQAKQVFQSLKNNRTYSELELSAWHQKYFNNKKRAIRNDGNVRTSGHAAQLQGCLRPRIHGNMKQSGMATNVAANGRIQTSNKNKPSTMRNPQFKASPKPRSRKDSIECSTSCTEQRRCTYRLGSDSSEPIFPMVSRQPTQLIYNNGAPSYKASLMHFVKDAGLLARRAAANKCQEYAQREKSLSVPLQQTPYTLTDKNSSFPTFCSWSRNPNSGTDSAVSSAAMATCFLPAIARFFGDSCLPSSNTNEKEPTIFSGMDCSSLGVNDMLDPGLVGGPNRKLETNELLRLFSLIGTPQFLERSKITLASNSSKVTKPDQSFNSFLSGEGAHTVTTEEPKQVVLSSMIQTGQCWRLEQTRRTSMSNLPSWKSQLSELKPLGQKRLAGPEPCLRLASKTSSSITLGFSEYASSGHPFRQSTLNQFRSPK